MREPNWANCSEEQLWKYVALHLAKNGIDTMLVGGAVVSIYSDGAYRSGDLDLVQLSYLDRNLPKVMKEIAFEAHDSRHYRHPLCKHLIVEFVTGPPGVGEDTHIVPAEIEVEGKAINLYSPTDCIRDGLASFIHFNAQECLDQAVLVALRHPYNKEKIKKWCSSERASNAFIVFEEKVKREKART